MTAPEILNSLYTRALDTVQDSVLTDENLRSKVEFVCRCSNNRAGVRFLMACLLAKCDNPDVDIRKPYTEIGDEDCYSGRYYDEHYVSDFCSAYDLPCNSTTAFLTPAFRNIDRVLTLEVTLVGRPPALYLCILDLLHAVFTGLVSAEDLLTEVIRYLVIVRDEKAHRMRTLLGNLNSTRGHLPLSAESIVTLIQQHLDCPRASRLPVLVVAAIYQTIEYHLSERVLPLQEHNAADKATGALGDLEITLRDDDNIVTSYEMKMKRVTVQDIRIALNKIQMSRKNIDNYIFITTDLIDYEVQDYAKSLYDQIGVEVVILDCVGFLRHFLHLFYRYRMAFLDHYQGLVLSEPDSAVSQPLKEAFLALRQVAES